MTSTTPHGVRCIADHRCRKCTFPSAPRRSSRITSLSGARRGRRDSSTSGSPTKTLRTLRTLRALIAILSVPVLGFVAGCLVAGCSVPAGLPRPYGAGTAKLGESITLLGWHLSVSHLRFESNYVLVDVDGAPSQQGN